MAVYKVAELVLYAAVTCCASKPGDARGAAEKEPPSAAVESTPLVSEASKANMT